MPSKYHPNPGHSRKAPSRKGASKVNLERPSKPLRTNDRHIKVARVEEANKKKKKQEEVKSRKPVVCDFNFVYVGNLQSAITEKQLESFFKDCGTIHKTIIRCSRGQAVTAGVAVPKEALGPRDRQYASIEFANSQSARKALAYHGMVLDGCELVVSASAADLPEVQDIVNNRIASMKFGLMAPHNMSQRPLVSHPTEPFTDFGDPRKDRHNILGFSFAKAIM